MRPLFRWCPPQQNGGKRRKSPRNPPDPSPDPADRGRVRTCCSCSCKPRVERSSRCGGGGDGGESGGCAVTGSDARAAPPHEVQLQARQAPHPHRYGRPSPFPLIRPRPRRSVDPCHGSWCHVDGRTAACRRWRSGSAESFLLSREILVIPYFSSCICGEEIWLYFAVGGLSTVF